MARSRAKVKPAKRQAFPPHSAPSLPASPDAPPEIIQLTLLLSGGQDVTLAIEPNDPLIQQLYEVLLDWEGKRTRRLFQIPLDEGQAMLAFPCDRLIGLVTDPPLIVQTAEPKSPSEPAATTSLPSPAICNVPSSVSKVSDPLVSDYIQLENFLTSTEQQRLMDYVLHHQTDFVSTTTSTGASNYRASVVLYTFPEFSELIRQRVQAVFPDIIAKLGIPPFTLGAIESQLTAHNDGHFYKIHNDNGSPDTATRELTYVYYFHQEPKSFSGGELVIYDSQIRNNYYVKADTYRIVEPVNNSIVFFLSRYMHEVLPIQCPSRKFADSRFTINGWIRRA